MPSYTFQVTGLGTVTADADTEACARHQVGESLGLDPDSLRIVDRTPGAPVFEAAPDDSGYPDRFDVCWGETHYCDCTACEPDLLRVRPVHAALGALALGIAVLAMLWRR